MSFETLRLIEPIRKALEIEGYTTPTPIQEKAIPAILEQRDLLGCAQTGTGKTAAFAIPILQLLSENQAGQKAPGYIRSLILTPTRELAIQIGDSFSNYGKFTGLKYATVFGGVAQYEQVRAIRNGVDILIATPGRLLDLVQQRVINLSKIEIFVLDEADRMLDMGFVNDVKKVIRVLPQRRQTLFFSATMPPTIRQLAATILVNPLKVEVTPVSSTVELIEQSVYFVEKSSKRDLLIHLLKQNSIDSAIVFTKTKHAADRVAKFLLGSGIKADSIHGDKSQGSRQRALANFKSQRIRVLVATDIAARGIDIDNISHIINYELPNDPETYVHRIGRTGRAGASGIAYSFCDREEKMYLRDIQRLIGKEIPVTLDHPFTVTFSVTTAVAAKPSGGGRKPSNVFRSKGKSWSQRA